MAAYRKPYRTKKRVYKKKTITKKRSSMVKLIKSVVQKTTELKRTSQKQVGSFGTFIASASLNAHSLGPSSAYMPIVQGAGQGDRIGNKIRTVKAILRFILTGREYDATFNPAPCPNDVMICIGHLKRSILQPTTTDFNQLYQDGNTTSPPLGDLSDLCTPFNSDYWVVSKKILCKVGHSIYAGQGNNVAVQSYSNNDYKWNVIKTVDITKCLAAVYDFNDGANDPQNSQTYIWYEAVRSDNIINGVGANPVRISWTLEYVYTDA